MEAASNQGRVHLWSQAHWFRHHAHGAPEPLDSYRLYGGTGSFRFIDQVRIPANSSVAPHTHTLNSEEIYVIISGTGLVQLDDSFNEVRAGDVVWNRPGGTHAIRNIAPDPLLMVVVDGKNYPTVSV